MPALLLLPAGLQAQEISQPDSLWKAGVEAYTSGDYVSAAEHWEDLVNAGLASTELYSNLASAYFKNGEIAPAILWWERALRLDPSDRDVRYNLEYARNLTQDKIEEVPEIFFEQWGHALCYLLPSNAWAVLCIVFLAFTVGLALLFLLGGTSGKRRWGFFGGVVALIVTFLCWDFAQWQRTEALRQDRAVVMKPVTSVQSTPSGTGAKDLFILHEGTVVKILGNEKDFTRVEIADGREGWLPSADIEVI